MANFFEEYYVQITMLTLGVVVVYIILNFAGVMGPGSELSDFSFEEKDGALTLKYKDDKKWKFTKEGHMEAPGNVVSAGTVQGDALEGTTVKVGNYYTLSDTSLLNDGSDNNLQVTNSADTPVSFVVQGKEVTVVPNGTNSTATDAAHIA